METPEDIKTYIAETLSSEASNLLGVSEIEKDASLQRMEALLASNCQKLCIGSSSQWHASESSLDFYKKITNEMKEPQIETPEDDEKRETAIYQKPDMSYEMVEKTKLSPYKETPHKFQLLSMNERLAKASAEHEGLLSPQFYVQSPGVSSACSSRDIGCLSDVATDQKQPDTVHTTSSYSACTKTPFTFPKGSFNPGEKDGSTLAVTDDVVHKLKRVEILDYDSSEENEVELVEWPKKYIESKGYCLGIQPGNFYKKKSRPFFYVKLAHRSKYEIIFTNNNQLPCDLDLYVNGKPAAAMRLPSGSTRSIDGPQNSEYAFRFYRVEDAPSDMEVTEGARENGVIKAVFTPCKVGSSRVRTVSEPLSAVTPLSDLFDILANPKTVIKQRSVTIASGGEGRVKRSLDISRVVEGVTFLQGEKTEKQYVAAPEMETDPSKRVILQLRLIASLDEEVDAEEEELYDIEPPPLPTRRIK